MRDSATAFLLRIGAAPTAQREPWPSHRDSFVSRSGSERERDERPARALGACRKPPTMKNAHAQADDSSWETMDSLTDNR